MKKLLLICFLLLLISGNQSSVLRQAQSVKLNFQHEAFIEDSSSAQLARKDSSQTNPVKSVSQQRLEAMKGSFNFNQVIVDVNGVTTITNVGKFTFTFTPFEVGNYFFNMNIVNPSTGQHGWAIQNLFIPGTNYTTYTQSISVYFPLDIIGVEPGGFINLVGYFYDIMTNPMTYEPTGDPGSAEVIPEYQENLGGGLIVESTIEPTPIDWYPDYWEAMQPTDIVYISCNPDDPKSMPNIDLDKSARDGEKNGCGPAAAANSLNWLKKMHPEINFPIDLRQSFNQLSNLMLRMANGCITWQDFIRAKVDFAEMYNLPIKVKYQSIKAEGTILSSTRRTQAECMDANNSAFPTRDFLVNEFKHGEAVEIGLNYTNGGGHLVVMNGLTVYNNDAYINFKDDGKQETAGGERNVFSRIVIDSDKIRLPGEYNSFIHSIISESYDPNYIPPPTNVEFGNYCQITRRLIPPGHKIKIQYPTDATSSYSTTIWQINTWDEKAPYRKMGTWNFNGQKAVSITNPTDEPTLLAVHNDDNARSSVMDPMTRERMYEPYTIDIPPAVPMEEGDVTSPGNESEYAGFSMGWDDDSAEEFGDSTAATVDFTVETGCSLSDLPQLMSPEGTTQLNVNYNILEMNKYWSDLEFVLGIVSVETPGTLTLSFSNSPVPQTIEITNETRDISIPIGGVQNAGNFSFSISTAGTNTAFTIDNIGVPTNVPMFPSSVEENDITPKEFILMQNYPNPFNPSTKIKYQTPVSGLVTLKIFDVLGKEVTTLVDEYKSPGNYEAEFTVSTLPSGVYFYRMTVYPDKLKSGGFMETKKMILLQ